MCAFGQTCVLSASKLPLDRRALAPANANMQAYMALFSVLMQ